MDSSTLMNILPLILLVVVFYFLLIRPQRKRQQDALKMQNSLGRGARVMTTTGLMATVVAVDNEDVVLEISPGVETRWVKASIGRVITQGDPPPVADDLKPVDVDESADRDGGQDSSTKQS